MTSGYGESLARLYGLAKVGEKYSLDGPRVLINALNNPLSAYDSILVGGTNGKGSTSMILAHLLRSSGLKVGLFTSPHLVSYRERIQVNGQSISEVDVCRLVARVLPISETEGHSFFETTWAIAAEYFRMKEVDIVVWEVGLGGRLDATNVCEPIGSIITNIALDHTAILGATLSKIAAEKAPIFRLNKPALTGDQLAQRLLSETTDCVVDFVPEDHTFDCELTGAHQRINASVAMSLLRRLKIQFDPAALATLTLPARLERIDNIVVDCAHNPHAVEIALSQISAILRADTRPLELVFGVMADKAVESMSALIRDTNLPIHLVEPNYPRRLAITELDRFFCSYPVLTRQSVVDFMDNRRGDRQYLILGSSFLAAEVKAIIQGAVYPECGIVTTAR